MRPDTSCVKSSCSVPNFWNLITPPTHTSYATPHSQSTCNIVSVALWQKQHLASSVTLLRTKLSCVGKMFWHALQEKILTLFGTFAFQIHDLNESFALCTEVSQLLLSAFLNCLVTSYLDFTVYLPFFVNDQIKASCITRLLKGTWRIASTSNWLNKAWILSLSHWWLSQSIKSDTFHSQISSSGWKRTLFIGWLGNQQSFKT